MPTTLPEVAVATAPGTPVPIVLPALAPLAGDGTPAFLLAGYAAPAAGTLVLDPARGSLTYTPAPGFRGADGFAYTVQEVATGALLEGRVAVTVNAAPLAAGDAAATVAGTPVVVPVLANDGDPDGDPLGIAAVVMSGHGTVAVEPDGRRLRYVPQAGFVGRDSFAYAVSDGRGGTAAAVVSVAVEAANHPPAARGDAVATVAGTPVTIPVLANDDDPDGDPLALAGLSLPGRGTLAANADRTVTYTPAAGHVGPDEFAYTVGDGRGGLASARVAVEVRRPNAAPVAVPDRATTRTGAPVTIPVLANDGDPDGDPLGIVALSLPARGALAVNPDRTVTYTPAAGHVGPDEFAYTVGDGWGGTATARVSVAVERPAQPAFANGYLHRRRLVVPAAAVAGGEHQGFPMRVALRGAWLRPLAAGGRMGSAQGFDLRFEAEDGVLLPHEVEAYDPAAGALEAWVRLPLLSAAGGARILLYYGRPGQAASTADPAALWRDYLAVWHLPAAAESGGTGRDLAPAGAVAGDADGLAGSVRLAGAGTLGRADAAFLDGLPALTVQVRARADATGHERGLLNLGSFGDAGSALTLRCAGTSGALQAKLRTTAGDATLTTGGGIQGTAWQELALAWASGDPRPVLHLDGVPLEPAQGSQLPTTAAAATDLAGPLTLGAGSRDGAGGGWRGLLDEVRFRAGRLPAAWLAAEHANRASPEGFFGTGPEDAPDELPGAVAVPAAVATAAGVHVDVDVLARAFVPAGAPAPTIASVGQPAHGTATAIGGRVRYTPAAGYAGADTLTFAIASGGKVSTGRITVAVAAGAGSGELPTPLRVVPVSSSTRLAEALAAARPGDHIELADGVYSGAFAARRGGTAADPVVVRAAAPLAARVRGSVLVAAANVWIRGLALEGANVELAADGARMTRCRQTDTDGIAVLVSKGLGVEIDRNELSGMRDRGISVAPDPGAPGALRGARIHRNLLRDFVGAQGANVHEAVQLGQTKSHTDIGLGAVLELNLFERVGVDSECVSVKSSGNQVRLNTLLDCAAHLTNRHGNGNDFVANWLEGTHGIRLQDRGGRAIGNRLRGSANGLQVMCGNVAASGWPANGTHPAADGWLLAGNDADKCKVGHAFEGHGVKATGTRLEAHVGPVSLGDQTGTSQGGTASVPVPTPRRLAKPEVGPGAP